MTVASWERLALMAHHILEALPHLPPKSKTAVIIDGCFMSKLHSELERIHKLSPTEAMQEREILSSPWHERPKLLQTMAHLPVHQRQAEPIRLSDSSTIFIQSGCVASGIGILGLCGVYKTYNVLKQRQRPLHFNMFKGALVAAAVGIPLVAGIVTHNVLTVNRKWHDNYIKSYKQFK